MSKQSGGDLPGLKRLVIYSGSAFGNAVKGIEAHILSANWNCAHVFLFSSKMPQETDPMYSRDLHQTEAPFLYSKDEFSGPMAMCANNTSWLGAKTPTQRSWVQIPNTSLLRPVWAPFPMHSCKIAVILSLKNLFTYSINQCMSLQRLTILTLYK